MSPLRLARPLFLATASEARRALVAGLGIPFTAMTVSIDESPLSGEPVEAYAKRVAEEKAAAVTGVASDALVITVDTIIDMNGRIIGKPQDAADARGILSDLAGRWHEVLSAIVLRDMAARTATTRVVRSRVHMVNAREELIDWYLSTNEWKGRAGAYAIQGQGAALVDGLEGCLTNVIGLSVPVFLELLSKYH